MSNAKLVRIGDSTYDAQDLAGMTYGSVPRDDNSPGAVWLRAVATAYANDREDLMAGDEEARNAIVDQMSGQLSSAETWQVVTDLKLYAEAEDGRFDEGLFAEYFAYTDRAYKTAHTWAIRAGKLTDALNWWLYETAGALLAALAGGEGA
ncbi:MAG TPA: hypothetical protein VGG75_37890 [Trebonia sp.]|jgi:hypothetical protein